MDWATLPQEILFKIFSYISYHERLLTVSLVCERWAKVSSDQYLNSCYVFTTGITTDGISQSLQEAPNLKYLKLNSRNDLNSYIKYVGKYNMQIKVLKIIDCGGSMNYKKIIAGDLIYVLNKCTSIETFKLENSSYQCKHLLKSLTNLPKLRKISLVGSYNIDTNEFLTLVRTCNHLKSIKLFADLVLSDNDLKVISETIGPRLARLKVRADMFSDLAVDYLITNNKYISVIHFKGANFLTEGSITKLSHLHNIKSLGFTDSITPWCLKFFDLDWAIRLIKIDLSRSPVVNDLVLLNLGRKCPSLEKLNLTGCVNITLEGVEDVLRNCKHLRHLNLSSLPMISMYEFIFRNCNAISQKTNKLHVLVFMAKNCLNEHVVVNLTAMELHNIENCLTEIRENKPFFKLVTNVRYVNI